MENILGQTKDKNSYTMMINVLVQGEKESNQFTKDGDEKTGKEDEKNQKTPQNSSEQLNESEALSVFGNIENIDNYN